MKFIINFKLIRCQADSNNVVPLPLEARTWYLEANGRTRAYQTSAYGLLWIQVVMLCDGDGDRRRQFVN